MKAIFDAKSLNHQDRAEMRRIFELWIKQAERGLLNVRIPKEMKPAQNLRGMHYHYRPEIFLQIYGRTDFRFPRERFDLRPGEMCIVPAGVPHGETVHADVDRPFRNLVVGFYNNTISLHFAYEAQPQHPDIETIEFFDAPNLDVFLTLTNSLVHAHGMQAPAREAVFKGMLLALLGLFRNIVETGTGNLNEDVGKIFQAKCIVREQFSNPDLRVQDIAAALGCSADYLSHLFHIETKERLTHYIQRIRIEGAILALGTTSLTVSEIAYSSGFADPAYFGRVFKQHKAMSPQEFRAQLDAQRTQREAQPKTVYANRVDFSPGTPQKKSVDIPPLVAS
ncbi:helix-turn-helix domain-containing protein [Opitutus terrae]|uniref:Transcriptional regulator, AraC family n=1 Tax=Opitutus terrae (strain DSM 11246 / JCM 15787 / PB90-1) TaxID=452637 RepID=B1ZWM9_OPITP|nr:AraC family transcriptional regulator [Opitutus terrae]ACB74156.1 transcriptional regulator, AraC family [Opitutus terrae PB90-1]